MPFGADEITGVVEGDPAGTESSCLPCPGGFTCTSGTVVPVGCPLGQYSNPESFSCQLCMPGLVFSISFLIVYLFCSNYLLFIQML